MQILSDIAVVETAGVFLKEENMVKKALKALCTKRDELCESIKDSTRRSTQFQELVFRLQTQVKEEDGARAEIHNDMPESPLHFELKEAQMNLEKAQADSAVSSKRISVAKATSKLLALISTTEQAYKTSEGAFHAKSQARLHSQVPI